MPARVHLFAGPAASGKSQQLLVLYRQALAKLPPTSCLWLAPTHRAAREVRRYLVDEQAPSCLGAGVSTFEEFAFRIVEAAEQPARRLDPLAKRRLLRRLIEEAVAGDELTYFGAIADSRGFIDLVAEWIAEFKRVEIWPEEFEQACRRRGLAQKDRELLALYSRYQEHLNRHDLYDSEGRLWSAREQLGKRNFGPYARTRLAVVDGFTDFTRTQHEMLELLASHVEDLYFTLPLDESPGRDELFAKSETTLAALAERHAKLEVKRFSREKRPRWAALAHLESELFKDPRRIAAASDNAGLEIVAAAGRLKEIEAVGRRIKRLLVEGDADRGASPVPAEEIAVVFRSLADCAPLVREVFEEQGIPYVLEAETTLLERPIVAALLNLVGLAQEDWPFRGVLSVASNNYFAPRWRAWQSGRGAAAVERVVRRLQVPSGRRQLLEAIRRTLEREASRTEEEQQHRRESADAVAARQADFKLAQAVLTQLAAALDRLPREADMAAWQTALVQLAEETGLLDAASADDRETWLELLAALDGLARLDEHVGSRGQSLSRAEFEQLLTDVARWHRPRCQHDETGRVRILAAPAARALSIPYLFLAGLTERSFPVATREDRLYSEREDQILRQAGLPLVLRAERNQEEMLLFYELTTRARRRLTLSYPALDERGESLLASPFLTELERAFGDLGIARQVETALSPVPREREPASLGECRVRAVDDALRGEAELLATMVRAPRTSAASTNVLAGLRLTRERSRREEFGPFEGILASDASAAWLAHRFGDAHLWSASQLELYAQCPFRFFAEHVLSIAPLDEMTLQIDHARRGWLLHETLATVHRHRATLGAAEMPLDEQFTSALEELLSSSATSETLSAALDEIHRRVIATWGAFYAEQQQAYGASWLDFEELPTPAHFEVSFGLDDAGDDALSTTEPLVFSDGEITVKIVGRIDRIDLARRRGRVVFNVIDYKTGFVPSAKKLREFQATSLQLDVYTAAAEDLLLAASEALPWNAGYWQIRKRGFSQPLALAVEDDTQLGRAPEWEDRRRKLRDAVLALVRAVRGGHFPMSNEDNDCTSRCAYGTICRVHQARSLDKQWSPIPPQI